MSTYLARFLEGKRYFVAVALNRYGTDLGYLSGTISAVVAEWSRLEVSTGVQTKTNKFVLELGRNLMMNDSEAYMYIGLLSEFDVSKLVPYEDGNGEDETFYEEDETFYEEDDCNEDEDDIEGEFLSRAICDAMTIPNNMQLLCDEGGEAVFAKLQVNKDERFLGQPVSEQDLKELLASTLAQYPEAEKFYVYLSCTDDWEDYEVYEGNAKALPESPLGLKLVKSYVEEDVEHEKQESNPEFGLVEKLEQCLKAKFDLPSSFIQTLTVGQIKALTEGDGAISEINPDANLHFLSVPKIELVDVGSNASEDTLNCPLPEPTGKSITALVNGKLQQVRISDKLLERISKL